MNKSTDTTKASSEAARSSTGAHPNEGHEHRPNKVILVPTGVPLNDMLNTSVESRRADNRANVGDAQEEVMQVPEDAALESASSSSDSESIGTLTRQRDSFHYFSDQNRRMAYLTRTTGNNDDNNQEEDDPAHQPALQRRRRLSFEVHPRMMMNDFLFGMEDNE